MARVYGAPAAALDEFERNVRIGAAGETHVARVLATLTDDWLVVHSLRRGRGDVDHVALGPPGLFVINTKHNPDARVTVYERALYVNGQLRTRAYDASRREVEHVNGLLPVRLPSTGVLVFVGTRSFTVKPPYPPGVAALVAEQLVPWMLSCPPVVDPDALAIAAGALMRAPVQASREAS